MMNRFSVLILFTAGITLSGALDCVKELQKFGACLQEGLPTEFPRDIEFEDKLDDCTTNHGCASPICLKDSVMKIMPDILEDCFNTRNIGIDFGGFKGIARMFSASANAKQRRKMYMKVCDEEGQDATPKTDDVEECMGDAVPDTKGQRVPTRKELRNMMVAKVVGCAFKVPTIGLCRSTLEEMACECTKNRRMRNRVTRALRRDCNVNKDLNEEFDRASTKACNPRGFGMMG